LLTKGYHWQREFVCVQSTDAADGAGRDCYGALCELVSQCDRLSSEQRAAGVRCWCCDRCVCASRLSVCRLSSELRRHQRAATDADRRKAEWRSVALVVVVLDNNLK